MHLQVAAFITCYMYISGVSFIIMSIQHKRLVGKEERMATELQVALDHGFENVKETISSHVSKTTSKLEQLSATNTEMTDRWIHVTQVAL